MIGVSRYIILLLGILTFTSCSVQIKINADVDTQKDKNSIKVIVKKTQQKEYIGWWVYGEGQHIFKDEETLEEYDLTFPNEDMVELVELYLSVCEMEYFPMECAMNGTLEGNVLTVQSFEILYIQGCGE